MCLRTTSCIVNTNHEQPATSASTSASALTVTAELPQVQSGELVNYQRGLVVAEAFDLSPKTRFGEAVGQEEEMDAGAVRAHTHACTFSFYYAVVVRHSTTTIG